jgi:hypothetical protein
VIFEIELRDNALNKFANYYIPLYFYIFHAKSDESVKAGKEFLLLFFVKF